MKHGFVRVACAIPMVKVADCKMNAQQIETQIAVADGKGVQILVFPELCITGATCGDLFTQGLLLDEAERALMQMMNNTRQMDIISIVGMPVQWEQRLLNAAVVMQKGKVLGVVPKQFLPNSHGAMEKRWFTSGAEVPEGATIRLCGQVVPVGTQLLFDTMDARFGIELGEDVWAPAQPSTKLVMQGADLICHPAAMTEAIGKEAYARKLMEQQSARCVCGYVSASAGFGESTTDFVFGGSGLIFEDGVLLAESERFALKEQLVVSEVDVDRLRSDRRAMTVFADAMNGAAGKACVIDTEFVQDRELTLTRTIDAHPFIPQEGALDVRCEEVVAMQVAGLVKRLVHTHCRTVVVGISGGLDSTLALLICVKAFDKLDYDRKGILGITMPGFGTTDRTYNNALHLMSSLGVTIREISIKEACIQHFGDIGHDMTKHDVTYENGQARERTQILMDVANGCGGMVIGTGDLSELALGWATYNGDHMSMYGVNGDVPKTLVKYLVSWMAMNGVDTESRNTLLDIVDTPISPELIPADEQGNIKQKTEDLVGPYELHDFFLYYFLRYGFRPGKIFFLATQAFREAYPEEVIKKWLTTFCRRFFMQQFKRSCLPDGPKVGSVGLSPRGDWSMPSDAVSALWLKECEEL